jgi:hypothetical protein
MDSPALKYRGAMIKPLIKGQRAFKGSREMGEEPAYKTFLEPRRAFSTQNF